jgi:hypothetical protein
LPCLHGSLIWLLTSFSLPCVDQRFLGSNVDGNAKYFCLIFSFLHQWNVCAITSNCLSYIWSIYGNIHIFLWGPSHHLCQKIKGIQLTMVSYCDVSTSICRFQMRTLFKLYYKVMAP